jgi:hypothetical protein
MTKAKYQHALPAAQPREIAHPQPIRGLGGEIALDQIRRPDRLRV